MSNTDKTVTLVLIDPKTHKTVTKEISQAEYDATYTDPTSTKKEVQFEKLQRHTKTFSGKKLGTNKLSEKLKVTLKDTLCSPTIVLACLFSGFQLFRGIVGLDWLAPPLWLISIISTVDLAWNSPLAEVLGKVGLPKSEIYSAWFSIYLFMTASIGRTVNFQVKIIRQIYETVALKSIVPPYSSKDRALSFLERSDEPLLLHIPPLHPDDLSKYYWKQGWVFYLSYKLGLLFSLLSPIIVPSYTLWIFDGRIQKIKERFDVYEEPVGSGNYVELSSNGEKSNIICSFNPTRESPFSFRFSIFVQLAISLSLFLFLWLIS